MKTNRYTRIPQSKMVYRIIAFLLGNPLRRLTMNPIDVLIKMGIQSGLSVLEVGCGPGFFTIPAAGILEEGKIYALDLSPFMTEHVRKKVEKQRLENVQTITSTASNTGLDDESIDLIVCIDVLSDITDIDSTLQEMYRVLKPDGILGVFEPHAKFEPGAWKPEKSIKELTATGLFSIYEKNDKILKFKKAVSHPVQPGQK